MLEIYLKTILDFVEIHQRLFPPTVRSAESAIADSTLSQKA
ncbi:hypothetical protein [Nostoc sp. DSM 114161]